MRQTEPGKITFLPGDARYNVGSDGTVFRADITDEGNARFCSSDCIYCLKTILRRWSYITCAGDLISYIGFPSKVFHAFLFSFCFLTDDLFFVLGNIEGVQKCIY